MVKLKIIFSFISIQSCQQILQSYEDLITSLKIVSINGQILYQVMKILNSFLHSITYETFVLKVVVPNENFQCFSMWLSQVDVYCNFLLFL